METLFIPVLGMPLRNRCGLCRRLAHRSPSQQEQVEPIPLQVLIIPYLPPINNVKDCANPRIVSHQGVHVEGVICDSTCKTVICQTYKNSETVPIEATYVFPLDEGAAVCGYVFFHALSFTISSSPPPLQKQKDADPDRTQI